MDSTADPVPVEINCQELKQRLDEGEDLVVIDCREAEEHAVVSLSQARLLPMSEIGQRLGELESYRKRRIVVHCHRGGRSLRVASWLRENGFPLAQSLAGGIDGWAAEIDPSLPRY